MPGLFFLISDLGPSGAAKTLALVVPALAERYRVAIGVLGRTDGPFDAELVEAGFPPVPLPSRGLFDFSNLRETRKWVRAFGADGLHAIGSSAARLASLLAFSEKSRNIIISAADNPGGGPKGWWTRKTLRTAVRVVAATRAEAIRYAQLGVAAERIEVIPPGVPPAPSMPDPIAFRMAHDIPSDARLVIAAGGFDTVAGLRSAVWAFDVIRYPVPDVYLILIGDGPERHRAERFARRLAFDDCRVRFLGARSDVPALLGLADVVWVTHTRGGINLALEAMAAGKPIVAAHIPDLAEIIEDGITGRLVPSEDRIQLAAVTSELLADPVLAGRLGAAGRARVAARHTVSEMVARYTLLYERTVGG